MTSCKSGTTSAAPARSKRLDIGDNHIVVPARRWAVTLDAGGLVFVDSDQLVAE